MGEHEEEGRRTAASFLACAAGWMVATSEREPGLFGGMG